MHKCPENNLMDYLYLCIQRKEHYNITGNGSQIAEILDPPKIPVVPKELLLPELFSRIHSSPFSTRKALSVIRNYWKK
jgi:hypothetical protein